MDLLVALAASFPRVDFFSQETESRMKRSFPFLTHISILSRNAVKVYRAEWDCQGQLRKPGSVGYIESGQAVTSFFLSLLLTYPRTRLMPWAMPSRALGRGLEATLGEQGLGLSPGQSG